MGHKKKNAADRSLHQQAYDVLKKMQSFGSSKAADKRYDREHSTDTGSGKIYSVNTWKTYWKHIKYFLKWVKKRYPEITELDKAREHVSEWLQERSERKPP